MALAATSTNRTTSAWIGGDDRTATDAIARITDARMLLGQEGRRGSIVQYGDWHVDLERQIGADPTNPRGTTNVQVQRNIKRKSAEEKSTVACLLVSNVYLFRMNGTEPASAENRIAELTRIIRQGLNNSLQTRVGQTEEGHRQLRSAVVTVFEVTGEFSAGFQEFVSPQKAVK